MAKRVARPIIVVLSLIGTAALVATIALSLKPTKRIPKLAQIDISVLKVGAVASVDGDSLRFFLLRVGSEQFRALAVPLSQGAVLMPEQYWFKPLTHCQSFEFASDGSNALATGRFRCLDTDQDDEWRERWQWNSEGTAIADAQGRKVEDMYRVNIERDDELVSFVSLSAQ